MPTTTEDAALPGYAGTKGLNAWEADADMRAAAAPYIKDDSRLRAFGALVGGRLGGLIETAHRVENLPKLVEQGVGGERVQAVRYCPEQIEARRLLAKAVYQKRLGLVEHMTHAMLSNFNGEGGITCPLAMTDGLIGLLEKRGTEAQKRELLPKLLSDDPVWALTAGQHATERQGGSNVFANETRARENADGTWTLDGLKWFCSNPGEAWVATAKVGDGELIGLYLVRRLGADGRLNGHRILRQKPIGGTKGKATVEIEYKGARAEMLGKAREGLVLLVDEVLSVSRRHVAAAAMGFTGRALLEAESFAAWREAYGRKVKDIPAAADKLARMRREWRGMLRAFFMGMHAAETGAPDADALTPLCKVELSKRSSWMVREAQLMIGGHGILDDFSPLNRLADDAIVNEIWEGTHPILAGHAAKALRRPRALAAFLARVSDQAAAASLRARVEATKALDEDARGREDESLIAEAYAALAG